MQNVIKRFILARKQLRLTQAELATSLGFKQSYISNIEKGRNEVTSNIVIAMYRLYNISPEWLITGQGNMISNFIYETAGDKNRPEGPNNPTPNQESANDSESKVIDILNKTLKSQETTIQMQEKVIKLLESDLERCKQLLKNQV